MEVSSIPETDVQTPLLAADDDRKSAVAWMLVAVGSLSAMDALGKHLALSYPVFQMLAVRSTIALALIALWLAARDRLGTLRTEQPRAHALRAIGGFIAFVCFYASLRHLRLADAVAIAFGSPFIVAALGQFVLGERVDRRRWLAIALGFVGMLVIVRPTGAGLQPAAALVIVSGFAYAAIMVLARWMTRPGRPHENTQSFVFYMLAGQAAIGWIAAIAAWRPLSGVALLEMGAMGLCAIAGNYGLAAAFRKAPVAVVAPLEYTGLVWALLFGAVFFNETPPPSFWVGVPLIVGAGVYTLRGEKRLP
jgi:drug/metabolite transporter (DMT)-like permease